MPNWQPDTRPPAGARRRPTTEATIASRFLLLADVAEILNIKSPQAYALVRSGELPAIQLGGRGQWRIEASQLEAYIERKYAETRAMIERDDEPRRTGPGAAGQAG